MNTGESTALELHYGHLRFIALCISVSICPTKMKAVNNRDRNFTRGKVERRRGQLEESVARYLS